MFKPSFVRGKLLKRNMLKAIRDYPYIALKALYSNYGDGILSGFEITPTKDEKFQISPGILKKDGEVYVAPETLVIKQEVGKHYVYLTIQDTKVPDGKNVDLECRQASELKKNDFELFKYNKVKYAVVYEYEDIEEASTNVDEPFQPPVNRIDQRACRFAVMGGATLCPKYFRLFAKEILELNNADPSDVAFAYQCLNGINNIEAVNQYFGESNDNLKILKQMKDKLERLKNGSTVEDTKKSQDDGRIRVY